MVDKEILTQALCYGVAQGEKLRIANWMAEWGDNQYWARLPDEDQDLLHSLYHDGGGYLGTVGEHISACMVASNIVEAAGWECDRIEKCLTRALDAHIEGKPIGAYVNTARVLMLKMLREMRGSYPDVVGTVIKSVAQYGIEIDLDAPLNETQKP